MRTPIRLLAGSGVLAAALTGLTAPASAAPAPAAAPLVLSSGHVDAVDVEYEDGELALAVHDDATDAAYAPSDVVLRVRNLARTTVPDDPAYAFLGTPGAPVWVLPEIQNPDLLWAGLSTEELEPGVFAGDQVTIRVERVRGPGDVAVFTQDAVGAPAVLADSGDGLPDTIRLGTGGHVHAGWAFDRPGTYQLRVRATATLAATGAPVTSAPATYTFSVQR